MAGKQQFPAADVRRPFAGEPSAASIRLRAGFGDRVFAPPASTRVVTVRQVHGETLVSLAEAVQDPTIEADGIYLAPIPDPAAQPCVAAIRTADCVPVLLLADAAAPPFAAAVHAGWRGTVAGIVARAVERATSQGVSPAHLHARLGPSIGPCCYEVGEEVAAQFVQGDLPVLVDRPRPHLDLRTANSILLQRAGLRPDRIRSCGPCTRCRHDLYWSYRAEPGVDGRQLSWIGWVARDE